MEDEGSSFRSSYRERPYTNRAFEIQKQRAWGTFENIKGALLGWAAAKATQPARQAAITPALAIAYIRLIPLLPPRRQLAPPAERIRRKYGSVIKEDSAIFFQCTDTIVRQVDDIKRMVDEFSQFARMPKPVMGIDDVADVLEVSGEIAERPAQQRVGVPAAHQHRAD